MSKYIQLELVVKEYGTDRTHTEMKIINLDYLVHADPLTQNIMVVNSGSYWLTERAWSVLMEVITDGGTRQKGVTK